MFSSVVRRTETVCLAQSRRRGENMLNSVAEEGGKSVLSPFAKEGGKVCLVTPCFHAKLTCRYMLVNKFKNGCIRKDTSGGKKASLAPSRTRIERDREREKER